MLQSLTINDAQFFFFFFKMETCSASDVHSTSQSADMLSAVSQSAVETASQETDSSETANQQGYNRSSWGWAIKNNWAARFDSKKGKALRCMYPGCKKLYESKDMSTSGINSHLKRAHGITSFSGVNDGSKPRGGPLDALFNISKQPKVFDPEAFEDSLIRFIVQAKLPFSIVENNGFQELLNQAQMSSTISQIKLPSNDAIAEKVRLFDIILVIIVCDVVI